METSSALFESVHSSSLALSQQRYQALVARGMKGATKLSRRQRNALYKRSQYLASLPKDAREFHEKNPLAEGLPCAYTLRFTDLINDKQHPESIALNSSTISLGQQGKHTGLYLNGEQIKPANVFYAEPTKTYVFSTRVKPKGLANEIDVAGTLNFIGAQPSGTLNVDSRTFNVKLDPKATWFDVQISTDSKAYASSGQGGNLVYEQKDFDNATWIENSNFMFGYDNKNIGDDLQPNYVLENYFFDTSSSPETQFELLGQQYSSDYTCIIGPQTGKSGSNMVTNVTRTIPHAPKSRSNLETVFPKRWDVQFSDFGDSFYGAYQTESGKVYGVKGSMKLDDVSLFPMLSKPTDNLPAVDTLAFLNKQNITNGDESHNLQPLLTKMSMKAGTATTDPPPLRVNELLGMDVMVPDTSDPSGYRDSVAQSAMKDFHDLIVYFMDEDLRTTFVQVTQIYLPDYLLQIAEDSTDNSTFYKKLQVPFITSMLAHGTMEEAKYCNGARADMKMKTIPSNDPVYQSHSSKLYRYHFLEKFPAMQTFLTDQNNGQYNDKIDQFIQRMKDNLKAKADVTASDNPKYSTDLKKAQDEIDVLATWAKDRNLYWALQLLYWLQNSSLPNWYSQYTTGSNTGALTMNLKKINAIFGVLEHDAKNTTQNGKNFMQAFNEDVRLFQMTSIVPMLIDTEGVSSELDTIIKECLDEYIKNFQNSPDPNHVEAVKAAKQLSDDDDLRRNFSIPWAQARRLAGATGAWNNMATMYETIVSDSKWFKVLSNGSKLLEMASTAAVVGFIIMGCIPGQREKMSPGQETAWALSLAGLVAMIVIHIAKGIVRFVYFFEDISGFQNSFKCILGFESVIDEIENSAFKIENAFARFFARTTKQSVQLGELDAALIKAGEEGELSLLERALGRNMGELLGTVLGLVLSIVCIVLTAIDLHNEKDPLLKGMDALMLCSAVIQLIGVVAGIIFAATFAGEAVLSTGMAMLSLCATWGGPLAIVFAIIGIIVFLVWFFKQDTRSPIQKFLDDRVEPAGLRMSDSNQAPEYFQVVPAKSNSPSLVGLGFKGPVATLDVAAVVRGVSEVSTDCQAWLKLNVNDTNIAASKILDYSLDMVWSMTVDADGLSLIYTVSYVADDKNKDVMKETIWYIATDDHNTNVIIRQMPDDDDNRKAALPHFRWVVDITTKPDMDGSAVKSARVRFSQGGLYIGHSYDCNRKIVDPTLRLGTLPTTDPYSWPTQVWADVFVISMQPVRPGKLSYLKPIWKLLDTDKDETNNVRFSPAGASSSGLSWSISPPLPNGFELVTSGTDEGLLRQVKDISPAIQTATEYTVSCQLPNTPDSSQSTKVTIEVDDHSKIAVAPE